MKMYVHFQSMIKIVSHGCFQLFAFPHIQEIELFVLSYRMSGSYGWKGRACGVHGSMMSCLRRERIVKDGIVVGLNN